MGTNGESKHRAPGEPWPELPLLADEALADDDPFEGAGLVEDDDESETRLVLITGALGNIGHKLCRAWSGIYDLILIDHADEASQTNLARADLAEFDEAWADLFDGVDVVVHLAGNSRESAEWFEMQGPNLDATANVLHAATLAGVERVILASSHHVMSGYRDRGEGPISEHLPPDPGTPQGVSKLAGERLGRACSAAFDLDVIALRLGWVQPGENRPETLPDDWARALWLSNDDCVELFTRAIEADLETESFVVINGTSRNAGSRWPLDRARLLLDYQPRDGGSP